MWASKGNFRRIDERMDFLETRLDGTCEVLIQHIQADKKDNQETAKTAEYKKTESLESISIEIMKILRKHGLCYPDVCAVISLIQETARYEAHL